MRETFLRFLQATVLFAALYALLAGRQTALQGELESTTTTTNAPWRPLSTKRFVADTSVSPRKAQCTTSVPLRRSGGFEGNDCAYIPLENELRLELMDQMFSEVYQILMKHNPAGQHPPLITFGTLIGALRTQDYLSWTSDNDLDVDSSLWHQITDKGDLQHALFDIGYLIFEHLGCGRICAHVNHPQIDSPGTWGDCGAQYHKKLRWPWQVVRSPPVSTALPLRARAT